MVVMALTNTTVEVSEAHCVSLWNATAMKPDGAPPLGTELRVLAEDEQDLGYGLCHVYWLNADGGCSSLHANIWKDTEAWETASVTRTSCEDFTMGRRVALDAGGLVLFDE